MNVQNILVIRLSSIGDILLTSPLVRVLRKRFPHANIDFVTKRQFHDLVRTNPHLNTIFTLDTGQGRAALVQLKKTLAAQQYDLVVDIHNNFRSMYLRKLKARVVKVRKYKLKRFLLVKFGWNLYKTVTPVYRRYINTVSAFGVKDDGLGLEFIPDPEIARQVRAELKNHGVDTTRLLVGLAPGAGFATKRWPIEYYAKLAQMLIEKHNAQILLFGSQNEAALCEEIRTALQDQAINLAGQFSLMQSACALNLAGMVVANDTGLLHLATALKKPTVAIFGSTTRELGFFPIGKNVTVVENEGLSCRPCTHIGRKTCPKGHFKCMLEILPAQVYDSLQALEIST